MRGTGEYPPQEQGSIAQRSRGVKNREQPLGDPKIADDCTGAVWDGLVWAVTDAWEKGDAYDLGVMEREFLAQAARGYLPSVALFCAEFVRAARESVLWEQTKPSVYDWAKIYDTWTEEERQSMWAHHDDLVAKIRSREPGVRQPILA